MNRDTLKTQLREILERSVGEDFTSLDDATSLKEGLNLDSVDMLSMTIEIQSAYDITIQSDEVAGISTVGDVLDLMQQKLDAKANAAKAA